MPKPHDSGQLKETKSKENEVFPAVNALLELALQYGLMGPFKGSTNASTKTIWTSEAIPEGACWAVSMEAQARGSAARARFVREALFYREPAGVLTQEGATQSPVTIRTDANISVAFAIVGNTVTATVTDATARDLSWYAWIKVRVSG